MDRVRNGANGLKSVSSGSAGLDRALGGGLPLGGVALLVADSVSAWKLTLPVVASMVAQAAATGISTTVASDSFTIERIQNSLPLPVDLVSTQREVADTAAENQSLKVAWQYEQYMRSGNTAEKGRPAAVHASRKGGAISLDLGRSWLQQCPDFDEGSNTLSTMQELLHGVQWTYPKSQLLATADHVTYKSRSETLPRSTQSKEAAGWQSADPTQRASNKIAVGGSGRGEAVSIPSQSFFAQLCRQTVRSLAVCLAGHSHVHMDDPPQLVVVVLNAPSLSLLGHDPCSHEESMAWVPWLVARCRRAALGTNRCVVVVVRSSEGGGAVDRAIARAATCAHAVVSISSKMSHASTGLGGWIAASGEGPEFESRTLSSVHRSSRTSRATVASATDSVTQDTQPIPKASKTHSVIPSLRPADGILLVWRQHWGHSTRPSYAGSGFGAGHVWEMWSTKRRLRFERLRLGVVESEQDSGGVSARERDENTTKGNTATGAELF